RNGQQEDDAHQGAIERTDFKILKRRQGGFKDWARDEWDHTGAESSESCEREKQSGARPAIGNTPAEVIADREIQQRQADEVGPDKRRRSEVRTDQSRGGQLNADTRHSTNEDNQKEEPTVGSGTCSGLGE